MPRNILPPPPPPPLKAPRREIDENPPLFSPDSPIYTPETSPPDEPAKKDTAQLLDEIRSVFFDSVLVEGFSLELEFKIHSNVRKMLTKSKFSQLFKLIESQKEFTYLGFSETTDWYPRYESNHTRKTCTVDDVCTFMEKNKIMNVDIDNTRVSLSSEINLDASTVRDIEYGIFRKKKRHTFEFQCWKFDFTEIQTNDPRYRDSDDEIFEIELELILTSEYLLFYTLDHVLKWGFDMFTHFITSQL